MKVCGTRALLPPSLLRPAGVKWTIGIRTHRASTTGSTVVVLASRCPESHGADACAPIPCGTVTSAGFEPAITRVKFWWLNRSPTTPIAPYRRDHAPMQCQPPWSGDAGTRTRIDAERFGFVAPAIHLLHIPSLRRESNGAFLTTPRTPRRRIGSADQRPAAGPNPVGGVWLIIAVDPFFDVFSGRLFPIRDLAGFEVNVERDIIAAAI